MILPDFKTIVKGVLASCLELVIDSPRQLWYAVNMPRNPRIHLRPDRVELCMTRLNMDTVALAYHSGVSPDYIYKILRGERPNISAINLASIANALGVSMEYLVGLSDEPEIEKLFRGSKYPISDAMLPWLLDKAAQLASVARKIEFLDEADRGAVTGFIDQQINQIDTLVAASTKLKSILPVE